MMMIVLRPLLLVGLKSRWHRHFRLRPLNSAFFSGGGVSVDSWTPGPKPLCHRHPTGPHPSGLGWTPAKGDSTKSGFALVRGLGRCRFRRAADAAAGEDRLDLGGAVAQLAQDIRSVLADVRRVLLRLVLGGARQAGDVSDRQAANAVLVDPV